MTENDPNLPTPRIQIDAAAVRRNLERMAGYARAHKLALRPQADEHAARWRRA